MQLVRITNPRFFRFDSRKEWPECAPVRPSFLSFLFLLQIEFCVLNYWLKKYETKMERNLKFSLNYIIGIPIPNTTNFVEKSHFDF